ncbi:hypothetical protein PV328_001205 [Microctonus aethiopoides]|uniref:Uncharacterized protein n=1 Tax=Microctonus aethiopoides TaxID=144406 RepID=A0AA39FWY7_9HYME|nr:hypothetical protein PV328_001205 [Microctonus aethiopoides]
MSRKPMRDLKYRQYLARLEPLIVQRNNVDVQNLNNDYVDEDGRILPVPPRNPEALIQEIMPIMENICGMSQQNDDDSHVQFIKELLPDDIPAAHDEFNNNDLGNENDIFESLGHEDNDSDSENEIQYERSDDDDNER